MIELDPCDHTRLPWRIHAIAADFQLEDVWRVPITGGPDDFARFVDVLAGLDTITSGPRAVRALLAVRLWAGRPLERGSAARGASRNAILIDQLPDDLRTGPAPPTLGGAAFQQAVAASSLYFTNVEWALAIASDPVDGIMHLGWVAGRNGHHAQLAILVKPHGLLGRAYLAAIAPARRRIVYPLLGRELARRWNASAPAPVAVR